MRLLRYVVIIALGTIIVPFLGIPSSWKQVAAVILGFALLVLVAFLKKALMTCVHEEQGLDSGASFQDSDFKDDVVVEVNTDDVENEILEGSETESYD